MRQRRMIAVAVAAALMLPCLTAYGADFAPIFPKQGAPVVAPPNFTWAAGDYDYFVLYLLLPIPGYYYKPIPIPLQRPYWACPGGLWEVLPDDGWGLWLVLGIDTETHAYEVGPLQYFQKVSDCVVRFPDGALEGLVREAIGKPAGDISASDLRGLASLSGVFKGISDIGGLEYCVNLAELDLYGNHLGDVSSLAALTNLTYLDLSGNEVVDLSPLAALANLEKLYLDVNQVVDLAPLAGLKSLTDLGVEIDQVVDLSPLAGLTNLENLFLGYNQVVDVSPLSTLTNLTRLSLSSNQIVDVAPLAGLTNLRYLFLDDNQIADMCPLVDNPGLGAGDYIQLEGNPLGGASCTVCIPELESRGATVSNSCP